MSTTLPPTVTLRPFADADYPAYVAIANESYPDYGWTIEEVRHFDADWRPEGFFERRVIAAENGVPVGYSDVFNARGQFVRDNYSLEVVVRPSARRRGIGLALYRDAETVLRARGAHWARNAVKESLAGSVDFARRIGAVELKRDWESRLDVASFDPAPFAEASARAVAAGVRITTLADELKRDPDAVRKAYALHAEARLDVPGLDAPTPSPYERFEEQVLRRPWSLPEAYFLGIRDARYVGESSLAKEGTDPTLIHQNLTGVLRELRGKGIAMALKVKTIEYARSHGYRTIRTWNDSLNKPMLAINVALGFKREPAWITFGKDLSAE
jgi:GNAT superfamily N-acetyltransferase